MQKSQLGPNKQQTKSQSKLTKRPTYVDNFIVQSRAFL